MLGIQKHAIYRYRQLVLVTSLVLACAAIGFPLQSVNAAWNLPTCNPDSVGPTDPSCLVSAPLNVSSASQTKTGALTIQNTVSAGQLNVSTAYGGNGTVGITTASGTSLNISNTDPAASAVMLNTNSSMASFAVNQAGTGTGISIQATSQSALQGRNSSATNGAVTGQNTSTGPAVTGLNNSAGSAAISAQNTGSYAAIYGTNNSVANSAIYGVNTNGGGAGGVRGCSSTSGYCGILGTSALAGLFQGPASVGTNTSRITSGQALSVYATNPGTGGLTIDTTNDATAANITASGNNARGIALITTGTNAQAITINSASTTGSIVGINSSGANGLPISIVASGANSTGIGINISTSGTGITVSGNAANGILASGTTAGVRGDSNTGNGIQGNSNTGAGGWFSSNTTTNSSLFVQNPTTGHGVAVETGGANVGTIAYPTAWPLANGTGLRATSTQSMGVVGYSTASTGYGVGVYGRATAAFGINSYGVVGYASNGTGVWGNSDNAGSYGGAFCNTTNVNCASLGGGTYSGLFNGRVRIDAGTVGNSALRVQNKNVVSPYGYAIQGYSQTATLVPSTPPDGTAIDGQAYNGSGVYGYSQQDIGVYGYGNDGGVYGLSSSASGYGVSGQATTGYGVIGTATTGRGVYGVATTGYGGYFTATGSQATTVYVANADTTYGFSRYGVDVAMGSSPGSVAYHASLGYGTGVQLSISDGGTGISINSSTAATGVSISPDEFNATTISTSKGFMDINNGGILGGVHIPNYVAPDGSYNNTLPYTQTSTINPPGSVMRDIYFDGADVWAANDDSGSPSVYRMAGIDGSVVQEVSTSDGAKFIVRDSGSNRLIVVSDTSYQFVDLYDDTVNAPLSIADAGTSITAASMVDDELWYAQDDGEIKYMNFTNPPSNVTTGTGDFYTLLNAAGYVWAGDRDAQEIIRIDPETRSSTAYSVTGYPRHMVFDGEFIWYLSAPSLGVSKKLYRFSISTYDDEEVYSIGGALASGVTAIGFDGINIWIGRNDGTVDQYNVAAETYTDAVFTYASTIRRILSDGTFLWIADGDSIYKIVLGKGAGVPVSPVRQGVLLIDHNDGLMYCAYIDSGAWTVGDPSECN